MLLIFFNTHDPTTLNSQQNDKGTQYRSVIYCSSEKDLKICEDTKNKYQDILLAEDLNEITTEIILAPTYYLAEEYHQQYLAKNPNSNAPSPSSTYLLFRSQGELAGRNTANRVRESGASSHQ